jgi:5-(carboxyamino)imidazole ribonucleotide synthase
MCAEAPAGGTLFAVVQRFDIGFLGGGQLARMSIQAAQRMGLKCLSLDPGTDTPASQIAASISGALSDPEKIAEILRRCDRITLENEFILADDIEEACEIARVPETRVVPSIGSLDTIQDKLRQRKALIRAGVPSPVAVALGDDPTEAIEAIGFPMMIKTRFGGYDGKGAVAIRTYEELERMRETWQGSGWLAEQFVPFRRELAVMVFRGSQGAGCFPTMETVQVNHVCDLVFPAMADGAEIAMAAVEALGGIGLYGVELFELQDGSVQVNEVAPRPHNTGHYTLDWGGVSQFEQHVRLVMDWPLVEPAGVDVCMANLLGQPAAGNHVPAIENALGVPDVFFHWYGKAASKPGRKMGHLNAVGEGCVPRAVRARQQFYDAWTS